MGAKDLVEKILEDDLKEYRRNCPDDITDRLFCLIEEKYMGNYNFLISKKPKDIVNKLIGKYIREYWSLENTGRCKNPRSRLINSYERHSN